MLTDLVELVQHYAVLGRFYLNGMFLKSQKAKIRKLSTTSSKNNGGNFIQKNFSRGSVILSRWSESSNPKAELQFLLKWRR